MGHYYNTSHTAESMIDLITTALATTPVGVINISVDGQSVTYSREQAIKELEFWQDEWRKQHSNRPPRAASMDLSKGF